MENAARRSRWTFIKGKCPAGKYTWNGKSTTMGNAPTYRAFGDYFWSVSWEISPDSQVFLDTVNLNLRSVFMASQAAAKHMTNHGGSIINISSVGGLVPDISQVAYGTSKAAINYLTKLIAVREAKQHIRCNAVLPGMTATEAVEKYLSDDFRSLFMRHISLGRMGLPEEIAEVVCYFSSDASAYTTGQILTVSGGFGLATPVYGDLANKTVRR